jgi:hypothetical protein
MQIIRNYPYAVGKAWDQLKAAIDNVQSKGILHDQKLFLPTF